MSSQYTNNGGQSSTWPGIYNLDTQHSLPSNSNLPQQSQPQISQPYLNNGGNGQPSWTAAQSSIFPNQSAPQSSFPPKSTVLDLLQSMPTKEEDPSRHSLWTELVRLQTRTLELQIAEARAKEKQAEGELLKLKELYRQKGGWEDLGMPVAQGSLPMSHTSSGHFMGEYGDQNLPQASNTFDNGSMASLYKAQASTQNPPIPLPNLATPQQTAMTPFDLEAMMQHNNLDNLFSWLPDFGDGSQSLQPQNQGIDPSDLLVSNTTAGVDVNGTNNFQEYFNPPTIPTPMTIKPNVFSPPARRSRTPPDDDDTPNKRTKRPEKKVVVELTSECIICSKTLGRTMIRAPKTVIPDHLAVEFACPECRPLVQPPTLTDVHSSGSGIGTVESRKRLRIAMEIEDDEKKEVDARRAFCDVCQRAFGSGMIFGGTARENMSHIAEIVCAGCDAKYSRCTDCGGGGGGRVGIGKWRMKQVFQPGRKTCSLSHTRLGDRPREIGVHVTPTDFTPEQLKEVLSRCKQLWNEKTLARLAVPEMLEIDLPSQLMNPIRDYADVEDIVTQNWPNRESMIRAEGADPARFKRLLGLVWAHAKSRRGTRTVDIEEEWQKSAEGDADDMSTVLDNVKRTNLVIPGGSELIGMWGGEWDMKHGSLLVSTFIPFEGTDGEDSTAVSVGEMITKVQAMRQSMNQERRETATKLGTEPDLVRQCEHLWVVSGGAMPLVRERIADILCRKRSFVHVEEYLTRHPDFANALNARPVGLHPDVLRTSPQSASSKPPPLILVRWLGKDFDAEKIREIKQAEFGGKAKLKKKPVKSK